MGKGKFIMAMAALHPEINFIGIEKYSSILVRASRKMRDFEGDNVLFVRMDAENLTEVFGKDEVDEIYLNFSDPWPKDRHAKRRLPSKEYLRRFAQILTEDGTIEFKTDNRALFDFAVEEVEAGGFEIAAITYDLHNDPVMNEGNIMTEYEERFSAKGNPICKYILKKK
jgi:tRNA (guanine-N7-)-methyltransferase